MHMQAHDDEKEGVQGVQRDSGFRNREYACCVDCFQVELHASACTLIQAAFVYLISLF